jgi:hypothetical protein
MQKKPVYSFTIFTALVILITGCKEIINNAINSLLYPPKKLIVRTWVKTEELHTKNGITTNVFTTYLPCIQDNEYKYDKNGYYELNQGGSTCYATQAQVIEQGNWEFMNNETKLKTTNSFTGKSRIYDVLLLDSNYNFITSYIDSSTGSNVYIREKYKPR